MLSTYDAVIENIRRIIFEKKLKQGTVAERAGFSKQAFCDIMHDRRKLLRVEHLPRLALALGISINELFEDIKDSPRGE